MSVPSPVAGIILAAGKSSRMGRDKAFVLWEGRTFVEAVAGNLHAAGCRPVMIVAAPAMEVPLRELLPDAQIVTNPDPDSEMLESLRIGLRALPGLGETVMFSPVDVPAFRPETVRRILLAARRQPGRVVLPEYDGKTGHPVALPCRLVDGLLAWKGEGGAAGYLRSQPENVVRLPVRDPGVTKDADTPEDLDALRREFESR
jgi:molybdenum cofactor cytidylyltransferase